MARVKRWPESTANWAFAMAHSRGGMVHSFSVLFKDEIEQLQGSPVGRKMPSGAGRTAQFGVQRLGGIGGVEDPADFGGKGIKWHHLAPNGARPSRWRRGAAALAGLAAAQATLRPATLLAGAFGAAARRPLARLRHTGDAAGFWRLLMLGAAAPACVTLLLGGLLAGVWPWISTWIFGGRYAGLEEVVMLWSVVMAIGCLWVAGLVGLQVLGRLRALALAEIGGALACAMTMAPLLLLLASPGALLAMAVGGVVQVTLLAWGVHRGLRDLAPASHL